MGNGSGREVKGDADSADEIAMSPGLRVDAIVAVVFQINVKERLIAPASTVEYADRNKIDMASDRAGNGPLSATADCW